MAQAKRTNRRQPKALRDYWAKHRRKNGAPKARSNRKNWGHKHHARTKKLHNSAPKVVYRYRKVNAKTNWHHKPKGNPGGESAMDLVKTSAFGAAGAVLSRLIPNWVLGTANTSWMGYGANIITGLALAWAGRRYISRDAGSAILAGAGIALVLRLIQDFTPGMIGTYVQAGGLGDPGMGALLPSSFLAPPIYTGQGAQLRIPPAWAPPPAAAAVSTTKGTGGLPNTYGQSTYGR